MCQTMLCLYSHANRSRARRRSICDFNLESAQAAITRSTAPAWPVKRRDPEGHASAVRCKVERSIASEKAACATSAMMHTTSHRALSHTHAARNYGGVGSASADSSRASKYAAKAGRTPPSVPRLGFMWRGWHQEQSRVASAGRDLDGGIDHGPGSNQPLHHRRMPP